MSTSLKKSKQRESVQFQGSDFSFICIFFLLLEILRVSGRPLQSSSSYPRKWNLFYIYKVLSRRRKHVMLALSNEGFFLARLLLLQFVKEIVGACCCFCLPCSAGESLGVFKKFGKVIKSYICTSSFLLFWHQRSNPSNRSSIVNRRSGIFFLPREKKIFSTRGNKIYLPILITRITSVTPPVFRWQSLVRNQEKCL